jgi:ABC-type dipeptide/oligopeptide/nickel transport system permease subunit
MGPVVQHVRSAATWPASLGEESRRSEFAKTLRRLARNKGAVGGGIVLALILLMAVFAPVLAPSDPSEQDYGRVLLAPGREVPMGTDQFGRDILSRVIVGSRPSWRCWAPDYATP